MIHNTTSQTLHLRISAGLVLLIALCYGIDPEWNLPALFDFSVEEVDLKNVFRAMMGLYVATSLFWLLGARRPRYWEAATISNITFMSGLALGRMLSLLLDGIPSIYFAGGLITELALACWGVWNLKTYAQD